MKVSKNFKLQEFVDKETYEKFGDKSIWFVDEKIIKIVQALRDEFGAITINNWHIGGKRNWSGIRTMKSSYYSMYSQHSYGNAVDMIFDKYCGEDVRNTIRNNEQYWFDLGIRAIENDVSWLHIDIRNTNMNSIKWFNV